MTKTQLKVDQFIQYAQAYGANIKSWPEADIEAAEQLLNAKPDLQTHLEAERRLDDLLGQHAAATSL